MGMSASQMRYCMLSGKKADVEFQGQQINQQRTTLATETSAINEQLLTMNVPTPPSMTDFTSTTYTVSLDGHTNTLGTMTQNSNGTYNIAYTYTATNTQVCTASNIENNRFFRQKNIDNDSTTSDTLKSHYYYKDTSGKFQKMTEASPATIEQICKGLGIEPSRDAKGKVIGPSFYSYKEGDTTKYVSQADLNNSNLTGTRSYNIDLPEGQRWTGTTTGPETQNGVQTYEFGAGETTQSGTYSNVQVEWSESGRLKSIQVPGKAKTLVSTSTTTDNIGFTDAMNEYEYQKNKYTQEMNKINAKMDQIEAQDKKLELKLKDLDTQQEALGTEMDSVKKVIDKNIESSFKAFA